MEEKDLLEIDLKDLGNAQDDLISVINNIKDVDGLDDEYRQLSIILQAIEDKIDDLDYKIGELEINRDNKDEIWAEREDIAYQDYVFEKMIKKEN